MLPRSFVLRFVFAAILAVQSEASSLPNRVAVGAVTPSSTVLWARSEVAGTVVFLYAPLSDNGQLLADWEYRSVHVLDPTVPAKVELNGLIPGTRYVHVATTDLNASFDFGLFRTPHLVGAHHGLRFGASGDARVELGPFPAIENVPARYLDFFMVLGDSIYADVPSDAVMVQTMGGQRDVTIHQVRRELVVAPRLCPRNPNRRRAGSNPLGPAPRERRCWATLRYGG